MLEERGIIVGRQSENNAMKYLESLPCVSKAVRLKSDLPLKDIFISFQPEEYFSPIFFSMWLEIKSSEFGKRQSWMQYLERFNLTDEEFKDYLLDQRIAILVADSDQGNFNKGLLKEIYHLRHHHLKDGEDEIQNVARILCIFPEVTNIYRRKNEHSLAVTMQKGIEQRNVIVNISDSQQQAEYVREDLLKGVSLPMKLRKRAIKRSFQVNSHLDYEEKKAMLSHQIRWFSEQWYS